MKKMLIVPLLVAALAAAPGLAAAKGKGGDDDHGKGKEKQEKHEKKEKGRAGKSGEEHGGKEEEGKSAGTTIVIDQGQRSIIQQYYDSTFVKQGNCPPGLAKKNNGCMPPGQAKKVWEAQKPLPANVVPVPLPADLLRTLGAPPAGYQYGYVDGEVLMYSTVGRVVVDSISSLLR